MTQRDESAQGAQHVLEYGTDSRRAVESALARFFADRRFIAAFVLLVLAAGGLNLTVRVLKLNFRKLPVPMAMKFDAALPADLALDNRWVQIAKEKFVDPDFLRSLGTDEYLYCAYVNAMLIGEAPGDLKDRIKTMDLPQQREQEQMYRRKNGAAVIGLGLTYYTGKGDTVAHIPERCYLGGGYDEIGNHEAAWPLRDAQGRVYRTLKVKTLTFRNPEGAVRHVAYFFHVNGRYEHEATNVRLTLANLFERRGYYAKVEVSCESPDKAKAEESLQEFLGLALPEIEEALPEWDKAR